MGAAILTLQICDHGFVFILEFLQTFGLLLLLGQNAGDFGDPLLKLLLLLRI